MRRRIKQTNCFVQITFCACWVRYNGRPDALIVLDAILGVGEKTVFLAVERVGVVRRRRLHQAVLIVCILEKRIYLTLYFNPLVKPFCRQTFRRSLRPACKVMEYLWSHARGLWGKTEIERQDVDLRKWVGRRSPRDRRSRSSGWHRPTTDLESK